MQELKICVSHWLFNGQNDFENKFNYQPVDTGYLWAEDNRDEWSLNLTYTRDMMVSS